MHVAIASLHAGQVTDSIQSTLVTNYSQAYVAMLIVNGNVIVTS